MGDVRIVVAPYIKGTNALSKALRHLYCRKCSSSEILTQAVMAKNGKIPLNLQHLKRTISHVLGYLILNSVSLTVKHCNGYIYRLMVGNAEDVEERFNMA